MPTGGVIALYDRVLYLELKEFTRLGTGPGLAKGFTIPTHTLSKGVGPWGP